MPLRLNARPAAQVDLAPMTAELQALAAGLLTLQGGVTEALDGVDNTKTMIRNRDERITQAQTTAAEAKAEATTLAALAATVDQRVVESQTDRASIHTQLDALTAGISGKVNDASIGSLAVAAILLGAKPTITVPLATPMPTAGYRVRITHSALVDLTKATVTNVQRTTTAVTFTLNATGVGLVAGTVTVLAVG